MQGKKEKTLVKSASKVDCESVGLWTQGGLAV